MDDWKIKCPINFRLFSGADVTIVVFRECKTHNFENVSQVFRLLLHDQYQKIPPKKIHKRSPRLLKHQIGFTPLGFFYHSFWINCTKSGPRFGPGDWTGKGWFGCFSQSNWNSNCFVLCFGKKIRIQHHNNNKKKKWVEYLANKMTSTFNHLDSSKKKPVNPKLSKSINDPPLAARFSTSHIRTVKPQLIVPSTGWRIKSCQALEGGRGQLPGEGKQLLVAASEIPVEVGW